MVKSVPNDINRGYIKFIGKITSDSGGRNFGNYLLNRLTNLALRLSALPILFIYGSFLILFLRVRLFFHKSNSLTDFYKDSISFIPEFISQYPMHLYPIVAKSIELAFLKKYIDKIPASAHKNIIELAIGEGTFSRRIFSENESVTGFDLNPYSLVQTAIYQHVKKRIVADCLNPPIDTNGASFLVCNNLLHHIGNKEYTLENWSKIAPIALFNENTNYWASGWFKPFMLRLLGKKNESAIAAQRIEKKSLQELWPLENLDKVIKKHYTIMEKSSFMNERVFFFCSICSLLLFCYGPPTPKLQKKILNTILLPFTKVYTYQMAKALIEYDAILPRSRDTFVLWLVNSKVLGQNNFSENLILMCPDCGAKIQNNNCNQCNKQFEERDGMLFLLPQELISEIKYSAEKNNSLGAEHL